MSKSNEKTNQFFDTHPVFSPGDDPDFAEAYHNWLNTEPKEISFQQEKSILFGKHIAHLINSELKRTKNSQEHRRNSEWLKNLQYSDIQETSAMYLCQDPIFYDVLAGQNVGTGIKDEDLVVLIDNLGTDIDNFSNTDEDGSELIKSHQLTKESLKKLVSGYGINQLKTTFMNQLGLKNEIDLAIELQLRLRYPDEKVEANNLIAEHRQNLRDAITSYNNRVTIKSLVDRIPKIEKKNQKRSQQFS